MKPITPKPDSLLHEMRSQLRMLEDWDVTKANSMEFYQQCHDFRQMFDAYEATIGFAYDLMRDDE